MTLQETRISQKVKNRAALGFRAHSGWAAVVAVTGSPRAPEVLDRSRDLGGPPWTQDQKLAALVAWLALARRR